MSEDENCRDCRQSKIVEGLDKRLSLLEADNIMKEHRLTQNEEKTNQVFSILTEIKEDIKTIASSVSGLSADLIALKSKPAEDAKKSQDETKRIRKNACITAFFSVIIGGALTLIATHIIF